MTFAMDGWTLGRFADAEPDAVGDAHEQFDTPVGAASFLLFRV